MNVICTIYYNTIIAYPIVFIVKSMASTLPWMHCGNEWNTPYCLEITHSVNGTVSAAQNLSELALSRSLYKTPADEFFQWVIRTNEPSILNVYVWNVFHLYAAEKYLKSRTTLAKSVALFGHYFIRMPLFGLLHICVSWRALNLSEKSSTSVQRFRLSFWPFYLYAASHYPVPSKASNST